MPVATSAALTPGASIPGDSILDDSIPGGSFRAAPVSDPGQAPILVYLVTEDWYFCLHRMVLARAAQDAGWHVVVVTRVNAHGEIIRAAGFELVPIGWQRRQSSIWRELGAFLAFYRLIRQKRPALVHCFALKAIVYGGLATRLAGTSARVATVAGLGTVFSSSSFKARLLRPMMRVALGLATGGGRSLVTLENPDDGRLLEKMRAIAPRQMVLVRGSGVDTATFSPPAAEPPGPPFVIAMACRFLRGKGAGVAIEAMRLLRRRQIDFRFILAGATDPHSAESFTEAEVQGWIAEGIVECPGWIEDVAAFWRACHVAVYPSSYGEGVPRSSIEAIACGRPLVTTDMPGCRDTVRDGVNGFLVPPRDPHAVADRLEILLRDPDLRRACGDASRQMAVELFSDERFIRDTFTVYRRVTDARS